MLGAYSRAPSSLRSSTQTKLWVLPPSWGPDSESTHCPAYVALEGLVAVILSLLCISEWYISIYIFKNALIFFSPEGGRDSMSYSLPVMSVASGKTPRS